MSDSKNEIVPVDLTTHDPPKYIQDTPVQAPIEAAGAGETVPQEQRGTEQPHYGKSESAFTPNQSGLIAAGATVPTTVTAQKLLAIKHYFDDVRHKPSLQNYADSQLGDRNLSIPVKELHKVAGLPQPVTTPKLVQRASHIISGTEATPDTFKEIYKIDPHTGEHVLSHIEKTPGTPGVPGIEWEKLSPYEKNLKWHLKKHGELPLRMGAASYDIGKGLSEENPIVGSAEIGAGAAMGAAPWLPKSFKGVPVRAIATGLGLVPPVAGAAIGSANAEPIDIGGMAVDYATGLMSPTELGDASLYHDKNETYVPGMSVLQGSKLQPKSNERNSLLPGLAGGGQPNMQAYAPGASRGIAPYGFRHVENVNDVSLPKGAGWMGALPNQTGGISTEISADNNGSQYPLINPNMNHQDINSLLSNQQPTDEMYRKAEQWAKYRQAQGKGPFISPVGEMRWPAPKK